MAPRALVGTTATALLVAVLLTAPSTAAGPPVERAKGCTVTGTPGPDVLVGTGGRDVLCGLGGKDVLRGRGGKDQLRGGAGNDKLIGGRGNDRMLGGAGNDDLRGRDSKKSHDVLNCGAGKADRASADPSDVVTSSCEKVTQKHAPVAVDDTVTTAEDAAVALPASGSGGPAANDTDADGDATKVVKVSDPTGGAVALTSGTITFTPAADLCGSAAGGFDYTVSDGHGGTDVGHVSVDIGCVPDPATATDDVGTVAEDGAAAAVDVLGNDEDVDGDPITISMVTQPTHGTVAITGGGTGLTYQPDADYCNSEQGGVPDSFTYTLVGGAGAAVAMTVTCANDPPVADDDTFAGDLGAIGNTALVVNDPSDGAPVTDQPNSLVAGDILDGDTDPDGAESLTVVAGTFATNDGGSVTIETDGDFVFHPATSAGCSDTSDFFDYTVVDDETPAETDTGRVTIQLVGCVWYVDNSAPAGGKGTSNDPFDTLVEAETASGVNSTVFVFGGTGTSVGYGTGFQLDAGGRLVGEASALTVDPDQGGALTTRALYPANPAARPALAATNEDVVSLDDGNEVRGLRLDPSGAGGGIGGAAGDTGGGSIGDVRIIDTGTAGTQPGLELGSTVGTFQVSDLVVDNSGATAPPSTAVGVSLVSAGTVEFASGGTVSITTKGAKGLNVLLTAMGTSVFDNITVTGSGSGGVAMAVATGSTTFTDLALTTTSGAVAAFVLNNAGSVAVSAAGTANVNATGGPGIDVTSTAGAALSFDTVVSTNSGTDGVNLGGLGAGTFTAGAASAITGAVGIAFDLDGGSGDVTFAGALGNGTGSTAQITGRTGGTATFSGPVGDTNDAGGGIHLAGNSGGSTVFSSGTKTLNTGASNALTMTGSDGHTLNLTGGGLQISTTGGRGLQADTSGTISVTGSGNLIGSTTGIALDVSDTDIGAAGLTFQRISSHGAVVGIRLVGTGTAGGLTVTGNGGTCTNADTAGCSGGEIEDGTGADSAAGAPAGTGIVLFGTVSPSFTRMWIHDHANYAIRGTTVTGFTLADSVINGSNGNNAASPFEDSSVWFANLTGSAAISDTWVSGGLADNFRLENSSGSLDRITFTGVTFGASGTRPENDALSLVSTGTAGLAATVTASTFSSAAGDLLQFDHNGNQPGDLVVDTSSFVNVHPAIAAGGGGVTLSNNGTSGSTTMNIHHNKFSGADGNAVTVVKTVGPAAQTGFFASNQIGTPVQNSGSRAGDGLKLQLVNQGTSTWQVTGNVIRGYNNFGIDVVAGGGAVAATGTLNTTIGGNQILQPGNLAVGFTKYGIHLNIGTTVGDTFQACSAIQSNTLTASGAFDVRVRQRQSTTVRLPGYAGTSANTAAVQSFVSSGNGGATVSASASGSGGGFIGTGSTCP